MVAEFREARGLMPLKVLVHGNDDLAGAATIAKQYKLPLVVASEALQAAADGDDAELAAEAQRGARRSVGRDDGEGGGRGADDGGVQEPRVTCWWATRAEGAGGGALRDEGKEGGEEAAEEEEGAAPKAAAPEFLLVLEAPDDVITRKRPAGADDHRRGRQQLAAYAEHNAEDVPTSSRSPRCRQPRPQVGADTAPESLMTKAAVYPVSRATTA